MTEEYSENSACTWHLGVCIDDPEDIAAFDEHMRNVVITPEMEDGKLHKLSKDAYIKLRSFQSMHYLRAYSRMSKEMPDISKTDLLIMSVAKLIISDIGNVTLDGMKIENTYDSKLKALKYQSVYR